MSRQASKEELAVAAMYFRDEQPIPRISERLGMPRRVVQKMVADWRSGAIHESAWHAHRAAV